MSLLPQGLARPLAAGSRWTIPLIGLVLIASLVAVAWAQWQQLGLLGRAARFSDDNVVWSLFQLETEALHLGEALRQSIESPTPAQLEALSQRYEIFVSRVNLVEPARIRAVLDTPDDHPRIHARLLAFVERADTVLAEPGLADPGQLALLRQELQDLAEPIHLLPLLGSRLVVQQADRRTEAIRDQVQMGLWLTSGLGLVTLAFAAMVVAQWRSADRQRRKLQALAEHLSEARATADQANQAKTIFLANMSHELRTPFNGLLGMLSLLDDARLDAEQRGFVHTARDAAEHLLAVLDDILDITRMESGRVSLQHDPLALLPLLREVESVMGSLAQAKGLVLEVHCASDVPRWVRGDATRIRQILFNLLGNGIKFTDQGRVGLRVTRTGTGTASAPPGEQITECSPANEAADWLQFEVTDTGIGMNQATLGRLFQRFSQGDDSISRRYGGTGLGLEISRGLARLMGGDIEVCSSPGQGSRFTLRLPLMVAEAPAAAWPAARPQDEATEGTLPPLDILVADDHPVNRAFMATLLGRQGHQVRCVADGEQALREAERRLPDVILMDLQMPVMDGLQATRALRDRPAPLGRVPIVALTADAYPDTRQQVLDAGMDDFLAKPVRWDGLAAALLRLQRLPHQPGRAPAPADTPPVVLHTLPPAPAPSPTSPPTPAPAPVPPMAPGQVRRHLNLETVAELCVMLSLDGYRPLLGAFFADEAGDFAQLCQALRAGDTARVQRLGHRLQGAAHLLGLSLIAQHGRRLADARSDDDSPAPDAPALEAAWRTSQALCRRLGMLA